jgi:hypothetical protein
VAKLSSQYHWIKVPFIYLIHLSQEKEREREKKKKKKTNHRVSFYTSLFLVANVANLAIGMILLG